MTSSSSKAVAVLLWVAVSVGCRDQPHDETVAEFTRFEGNSCTGVSGHPIGNMDLYVVQVFEVEDAMKIGTSRGDCQHCVANPELCHLEKQLCRCGGPVAASPDFLQQAMDGTRIEGIDNTYAYCLRVLAVERGVIAAGSVQTCECDPDWTAPMFLTQATRLCALSSPRGTGPLDFQLDVRCPGDIDRNGSPFNECVFPRM
jgi:hypothetical protein